MATCNWTRRFDAVSLPRWTANKEFEQLALAIIRHLPLTEPRVLTVKGLAHSSDQRQCERADVPHGQ
jgi:hypothetical protein